MACLRNIIIAGVLLAPWIPFPTAAQENGCFWANPGDTTCAATFADKSFQPAANGQCVDDLPPSGNITVCCCPSAPVASGTPKYIIMSSVIGFFAIITGGYLFLKYRRHV